MGNVYYDGNRTKKIYYDTNQVKKVYYDTILVWTSEEYSTSALTAPDVDPYYKVQEVTFGNAIRPVTITCSYNVVTKNNDTWLRHAYVIVQGVRADGTVVNIGTDKNQISIPPRSNKVSGSLTIQCSSPNDETFVKYRFSLQTHGYQMNWGNVKNIRITAYYKES